jgi:NTP pyrophosphatase (non-canonical NTP hydrolase)
VELNDSNTTFAAVKSLIEKFIQDRDWKKFHTPRNLAESICIESAELLEIFQWTTADEAKSMVKDAAELKKIQEELADILIYCISMLNATGTDIVKALLNKIRKNETKYPSEVFKGTYSKMG